MFKYITLSFFLLFILFQNVSFSQITGFKRDLLLENVTKETQLAISLHKTNAVFTYIQNNGLQVKKITPNWIFLTINGEQFTKLVDSPIASQLYTEIGEPQVMNDTSKVRHQVNQVQNGLNGLQTKFRGNGVVLGFVDTGLDFTHPDFKDSLGKTRVYSYWDQTKTTSTSTSPQPYNYGENWTASDIDNGICTAVDNVGHGTHVVGIAAGNGRANGKNMGMAPEATIVMVQTNNSAKNWTLTVSDACDYIFKIADQLGKPCVINISYGVAMGSHDGNDPASELIEGMLDAKPGRIVVAAAGNNGNLGKYHVHGDVSSDTSFFWVKSTSKGIAGTNSILLEMWADSLKFKDVQFATGANIPSSNYALRGKTKFRTFAEAYAFTPNALRDTIFNENGIKLAYVDYYAEMINHECHMQTAYTKIDSTNYLFQFMSTGSGSFDVWSGSAIKVGAKNFNDFETSNIPSASIYPAIVHYQMADTLQTVFSSYISSEKVMTVGNVSNKAAYTTKDGVIHTSVYQPGEVHASSSKGPNRKGVVKPDIMASGTKIFSANPMSFLANSANNANMDVDGFHMLNSGTSMASPLVAGIAALYLEKCSNANYDDFKKDVIATAKQYSIEGSLPNFAYGNGEIDALALLLKSNPKTSLLGSTEISCINPSTITVNSDRGIASILWADKDVLATKTFSNAGVFSYKITDTKNCSYKDSVVITQATYPKVSLTPIGNSTITCTNKTVTYVVQGGTSYQWSGGNDTTNDTNSFSTPGIYKVTVSNNKSCTTMDSITILSDTIAPKLKVKFLSDSTFTCTTKTISTLISGITNHQWSGGATPTKDTNNFSSAGVYTIHGIGSNGCVLKDSITLTFDTIKPIITFQKLGNPLFTCTNQNVKVVVLGGTTSVWNGGKYSMKDTNEFVSAGKYFVTVTGKNGCINTDSITLLSDTIKPKAVINLIGNPVLTCTNKTVKAVASGGNSYQWFGGNTPLKDTNTFSDPGTYSLITTGTNGCQSTKNVAIQQDTTSPNIQFISKFGFLLNCQLTSLPIIATGGATYSWSGGLKNQADTNVFNQGGKYSVTSTGSNGCISTKNFTIFTDTVRPAITFNYQGDSVINCITKVVRVLVKGGFTYQWNGGVLFTNDVQQFPNSGNYTVTATGTNHCTSQRTISILDDTLKPKYTLTYVGNVSLTCKTKLVQTLVTGGNAVQWDGGTSMNSTSNSFDMPGIYHVTITGQNGCSVLDSMSINSDTIPLKSTINFIGNPKLTCVNKRVKMIVTGGVSYQWNTGTSILTDTNSVIIPGTYSVTITDTKGCQSIQQLIVIRDTTVPELTINFQSSPYITCDNDPVKVQVVGATTYTWNGGKYVSTDSNTFITPGTYTVVGTDTKGCVSSASVTVDKHSYPSTPIITQKDSLLICSPSPNYQWYLNGELLTNETSNTIKYMIGGTYFVSTEGSGCISTSQFFTPTISGITKLESIHVRVYPNPTTSGSFTLEGLESSDQLTASDVLGKKVALIHLQENEYQLDSVANGVYFLSIIRNTTPMLVKIVKN
jgi:hypothetical protein